MRIVDLRSEGDKTLLARFVDLYERAFAVGALREDPALWPARLWRESSEPEPVLHVLVALDGHEPVLLGGVVCEYYRTSDCGLVTYLAVETSARRSGVARALLARAHAALRGQATLHGGGLALVFAEVLDPSGSSDEDVTPAEERLTALACLGAQRLDLPYVQPDLGSDAGRVRGLWLLALDRAPGEDVNGAIVRAFLHEFYRGLGIADPDRDVDFRNMIAAIGEHVPLRPLRAPASVKGQR